MISTRLSLGGSGRRQSTRRHRAGIGRVALVAFVLLMLVLPLTGGRASAADDELIILDDTVELAPVDDTVVDDPTLEETETPSAELDSIDDPLIDDPLIDDPALDPGLDPGTTDPVAGPSDLYVNPILCPADLDLFAVDYYGLAAGCQGGWANGYTVNVSDLYLNPYSAQVVADGPVFTAGLPEQSYLIGIADPAAAQVTMRVICSADDALGNDVIPFADAPVFGNAELAVQGDLVYWCDAFVLAGTPAVDDPEGGSIRIDKYTCADGFDPATQDVYTDCVTTVDGIQFNVSGPNGYASQSSTGDSVVGAVTFGGLEEGHYEVVETVPAGYAAYVVTCSSDTKQFLVQHEQDLTGSPVLPWELDDNEDIVCSWYNVPSGYDDSVDVFITKWGCPEGSSSYTDAHDELLSACDEEMEGIDFTIEHAASGMTATDDTGGQPARAAFTPWYTGESTITEDVPSGYGEPKVYCYVTDDFGDVVPGYELEPYPATDGAIDLLIPTPPANDLYTVYCDWFNVPSHEDGTVTIHKWECPEGTTYGESVDYYLTECTEAMHGVDFEQGPHSGSKQTVTTDGSGEVSFPVDEDSDWSIEEVIPSGYDENPMAFCRWGGYATDEDDETLVYAIDGFANLGPNGGTTLRFDTYERFGMDCNWFNFPYDSDSDVTVYKYTCPAGYDLSAWDADPKMDCGELTNGVGFHIDNVGVQQDETTGDDTNGAVDFQDTGFGDLTIWEDLPSGTVDTWVTCQWYEATGPYTYDGIKPYAPVDGVGDHISVELAKGDDLICQWYNVPERTWDGGELTITKYWCQGLVVNPETCELGSGVAFLVEAASGEGDPIQVETGPGGSVSLNLPEGAWTVTERDYEWCKAAASNVDADGTILTESGEETTLTVYNCNADTGKKNPPVTTFPNTGSGAMASAVSAPSAEAVSAEILAALGGLFHLGLVAAGRTLGLSPAGILAAVMSR